MNLKGRYTSQPEMLGHHSISGISHTHTLPVWTSNETKPCSPFWRSRESCGRSKDIWCKSEDVPTAANTAAVVRFSLFAAETPGYCSKSDSRIVVRLCTIAGNAMRRQIRSLPHRPTNLLYLLVTPELSCRLSS